MFTKIKGKFSEKAITNLVAVFLPLAFFAATMLLFGIRFETNDDATLGNIASGAYGAQSEYLIYVNILFGYFLKPFYAVLHSVNWYVIFQIAAVLGCFMILCKIALDKLGLAKGVCLSSLILIAFGVNIFTWFQYVKNSGVIILTGLVLIVLNLGKFNRKTFFGIFLCFFGSMLRFDNFYAIGALSAFALIYAFFKLDKKQKIKAIATMAILFVCVFGAKTVDTLIYNMDEDWAYFTRYNQVRMDISDFKLQFLTDKSQLEPLGYTANDYDTINNWGFYDPEVFTAEKLEEISNALPSNGIVTAVKETIYTCFQMLYKAPFCILIAAVLVGCLLFCSPKRLLFIIGNFGMLSVLVLYLRLMGRFPHRVEIILALSVVVFSLLLFENKKAEAFKPSKTMLAFIVILFMITSLPYFEKLSLAVKEYPSNHLTYVQEFEDISADKDNLYLMDITVVNFIAGFDVFETKPRDYFSNIVFLGGWTSESPFAKQVLNNYEFVNPYQALASCSENTYLVDYYYTETKMLYIKEHYGKSVSAEEIYEIANPVFKVYKVKEAE